MSDNKHIEDLIAQAKREISAKKDRDLLGSLLQTPLYRAHALWFLQDAAGISVAQTPPDETMLEQLFENVPESKGQYLMSDTGRNISDFIRSLQTLGGKRG
ncbi:MAG: hypothetical protein ABI758_00875 [Candidatus Woesebacteria bacterium]